MIHFIHAYYMEIQVFLISHSEKIKLHYVYKSCRSSDLP